MAAEDHLMKLLSSRHSGYSMDYATDDPKVISTALG